jgi:hypothetical protein
LGVFPKWWKFRGFFEVPKKKKKKALTGRQKRNRIGKRKDRGRNARLRLLMRTNPAIRFQVVNK